MKAPFKTPVNVDELEGALHVLRFPDRRILTGYMTPEQADYIATAINSHEALVEALEHERYCRWCTEDGCTRCSECKTLEALALAKGENKS